MGSVYFGYEVIAPWFYLILTVKPSQHRAHRQRCSSSVQATFLVSQIQILSQTWRSVTKPTVTFSIFNKVKQNFTVAVPRHRFTFTVAYNNETDQICQPFIKNLQQSTRLYKHASSSAHVSAGMQPVSVLVTVLTVQEELWPHHLLGTDKVFWFWDAHSWWCATQKETNSV